MTDTPWALYMGCVVPNRLPYMEVAMRETLSYFEIPTQDISGFTCCPNPLTLSHIDHEAALAISARNLAIAEEKGLNILTPCNGCFEALKGTGVCLQEDAGLREKVNTILSKTGHEYKGTNQNLGVGIGMAWDKDLFKYLWMWQVYGGHDDYPWYGRTYNCALEPFTSYPPAGVKNAIDKGTALIMQPGEVIETDLVAVAYEGKSIKRINRDGTTDIIETKLGSSPND